MKPKGLLIVATNNGKDHIKRLLRSMRDQGHSFKEWPLAIVDTGSTDLETLAYLKTIADQSKGRITLHNSDYSYDTGAYIWAYENFPEVDRFVFMHDSLEVKHAKWADAFVEAEHKQKAQASGWLLFPFFFDNPEQQKFITDIYGVNSLVPTFGIFGPIFSIRRKYLDQLRDKGYLNVFPDTKMEAQGFERGWMIGFNNLKLKVAAVEEAIFNDQLLTEDGYTHLRKHRPGR